MKIRSSIIWFSAFAAIFAALATYVFWGTWGLDACPYMPDSQMVFPKRSLAIDFLIRWVGTGLFVPYDLRHFVGSGYLWQELQYVIGVFCSALGMAYYMRGRGFSYISSYGSGLLLAFCGYWLTLFSAGHSGWFIWMMPGVFAFGLVDRAIRKNKLKNWVLLGACVAWASFYQPDLWLLFTLFTCVYGAWCCARERKFPSWRGVAVAGVVFALIAAPSINHAIGEKTARERQIEESRGTYLTGGATASDEEARWIFVTNWSLPPDEIAEFFIPRINGDTSCRTVLALGANQGSGVKPYTGALGRPINAGTGNYRQHSLYVGWVTCLLAVISIVFTVVCLIRCKKCSDFSNRSEVLFFSIAAIVFCLLSLGRYFEPLYRIVFALPVGDSIRAPVKWHHLTEFCVCVLAGYGIEFVRRKVVELGVKNILAQTILGVLVVYGACDLAACARRYCAVIDLSVVHGANPAAEAIMRRGGGKLADLVEGSQGPVAWSFTTRGIVATANPFEQGVRFVWAPAQLLGNPSIRTFLERNKSTVVGTYRVDEKAIRSSARTSANVVLFELAGVAPSKEDEPKFPPFTFVTFLGIVSLAAGTCAAIYGAKKS